MTPEDYRSYLETAFPEAVANAIQADSFQPDFLNELTRPAQENFCNWGYRSPIEAFEDTVPKSSRLTLNAWSEANYSMECWNIRVSCKAFLFGVNHAHIEINNLCDQPLPFTETGYRSYFVPLPAFRGNRTLEDFIRHQFPKTKQLSLF